MVRHFKVENFKSIKNMELTLGRINIFVGSNGAGKSNILEAMGVVSSAAYGIVDDETLLRRGVRPGVPRLYKTSSKKYRTSPHITFDIRSDRSSYKVALLNPLENPLPKWHYKTEKVTSEEGGYTRSRGVREKTLNPENGIVPAVLLEQDNLSELASFLAEVRNYAIYSPNTATLRGVLPDQQMRIPVGLSGGGLSEGLYKLQSFAERDEVVNDALEDVAALFEWVEEIGTATQAGDIISASTPRLKRVITFTDCYMKQGNNKLTAGDASEGILYALFLMVLCLSKESPPILSIDNIDQALNPRLVKAVIHLLQKWLEEGVYDKQILCTAHNPALLDAIAVSDDVRLFIVERDSDGMTVVSGLAITPQLVKLSREKNIPLSRLWVEGYIGGVPNVGL